MKLYLHIGWSKTGSTSIQTFLHKNRQTLLKFGFLVPRTGKYLSRHFDYLRLKGVNFENLLKSLNIEILESKCGNVVISDESFNKLNDLEKLQMFCNYFNDIEIIAYLRRQDLLLESYYNQAVKKPWNRLEATLTFSEATEYYKSAPWFNFFDVLNRFKNIFELASFRIFPFEKRVIGTDVVAHFCGVLGLPLEDFPEVVFSQNDSVPHSSLGVLRRINQININLCGKRGIVRSLIHERLRELFIDESRFLLSEGERIEFLSHYSNSNKNVLREFLPDSELFSDPLPTNYKVQEIRHFSDEYIIKEILAPVLLKINDATKSK